MGAFNMPGILELRRLKRLTEETHSQVGFNNIYYLAGMQKRLPDEVQTPADARREVLKDLDGLIDKRRDLYLKIGALALGTGALIYAIGQYV